MAPSLAGKPPFATDLSDDHYQNSAPQPRLRQAPPPNPNARTSAYNHYDNLLDEKNRNSGYGNLGMGLLNGDMDDEDDDVPVTRPDNKHAALAAATAPLQTRQVQQQPITVVAPRPGYAAPIAKLNNLSRPEPAATPDGRMPAPAYPFTGMGNNQYPDDKKSISPPPFYTANSPVSVPSTPHPLNPPMTPITPIFARPVKAEGDVQFAQTKPIMRGDKEGTLLPRRGERGDDFWRRFSMVVKDPTTQKESSWLTKTQNGTTRLSRWVWVVGLILLITAAGAIGLGWYVSHNAPSHQQPSALGGSENNRASAVAGTSVSTGTDGKVATSIRVIPTHTVQRRQPEPTPFAFAVPPLTPPPHVDEITNDGLKPHQLRSVNGHHNLAKRHSKRHTNRTTY